MYRIAIVEDEEQDFLRAEDYLQRYGQERNVTFHIQRYESAEVFLTNYQSQFDIVFGYPHGRDGRDAGGAEAAGNGPIRHSDFPHLPGPVRGAGI